MINEYAVKLAVQYLDRCFANGSSADLVGMLRHVDYFDRLVLVHEEVQEVLKVCPSVYVQRVNGRVIFTQSSGDREITEEDLVRSVQTYSDEFWAESQQLQSRKNKSG